jgi:4-amino-4-deoxy-L-arabinose transferase-like glycosyltransferase
MRSQTSKSLATDREGSSPSRIALALAVGLVARIALTTVLFNWADVPTMFDDATYAHFADVLLQTGRLESHHFPIGYPLFVAFLLKVGGASFVTIRVAHVLLGLLTIVLVSTISDRLFGRRAGVLAAWLTALYPPLVFMTGRIMSETLFITLLMFSLLQFLKSDRDGRAWRGALAGGCFALASIVRSNLVPMLAFIPFWQVLRPAATARARLSMALAAMATAGVVLVLPGLYFLATQGEFIPLATNGGQTFYGANNALADGGWIQVENHPELLAAIPESERRSASSYNRAQFRLGVQWIREHPRDFLTLLPKKFGNAWVPGFQSSQTTGGSSIAFLVFNVSTGLVLVGAIIGRSLARPVQRDGILLAIPITYTVMSLAFYGNPRVGLFCAPILIIYSSALGAVVGRRAA